MRDTNEIEKFTLKETLHSTSADTSSGKSSAPQGIGMAVAFDWGLAVELLIVPFLSYFVGLPASLKQSNMSPALIATIWFLLSLPVVIFFAFLGEGIRRGWNWARRLQILGNAVGFLGGFALLFRFLPEMKQGNYWSLVAVVILLIFSPLIAWRLSRPATARWFATVTSAESRKRHSGLWIVAILAWAVVGGVLQAWASAAR